MENVAQKDQAQSSAHNELQNCELSVEDLNQMEKLDRELVKDVTWIRIVSGINNFAFPDPNEDVAK
jgi:hypothetical protein